MRHFVFVNSVALLVCCWSSDANGAVITTFQDAFQLTTPAPGWAYLWNDSGPIGDPANYTPLLPNSLGTYAVGGVESIPGPSPGSWTNFTLSMGVPTGHPGEGALQPSSGGIERYAIAAYTLTGSGQIAVWDGWLRNSNPSLSGSTDGLNLKIFVNTESSPRLTGGTPAGYDNIFEFNVGLGDLQAGDTIYVAVGSKDDDSYDGFQLRYDIVTAPEPSAARPGNSDRFDWCTNPAPSATAVVTASARRAERALHSPSAQPKAGGEQ